MFRHPARRRVSFETIGPSMTKQEFAQECDIHYILAQYKKTGIIDHIAAQAPTYGDLPDPVEFQEALNIINNADTAFEALPAVVRQHFGNDPEAFLKAFHDRDQHDYLREHGFLVNHPAPRPTPEENNVVADLQK